jgi:hypothetical protein
MNKGCFLLLGFFLSLIFQSGKVTGMVLTENNMIKVDTTLVFPKVISPDVIEKYKSSDDFIYIKAQPVIFSFWDRLLYKIGQTIKKTIGNRFFSYMIMLVFLIVFVLLIIRMIGSDFQTLFARNKRAPVSLVVFADDNIEKADFDKLISLEIEKDNLSLAVRYLYLKLLQVLSQQKVIQWQSDKTNREYARELSNTKLFNDFKKVTSAYEYVWYGKFQITRPIFDNLHERVNQLISTLND